MKFFVLLCLIPALSYSQPGKKQLKQWKQQANRVTIIRDNWGIPHIYGKSDADAVFGMLYAQCEDDFQRVEMNYIEKLGRLSELNGDKDLYNDLMIHLLIDSNDAKADFEKAEPWLKALLNAHANGINYFLFTHPQVKPKLLTTFQPWYPLLWTDGSIGAINTAGVTADDLKKIYSNDSSNTTGAVLQTEENLNGSNGFAIAPSKSATGNAMLYINPHVTFYFRPEIHMVSKEGLNTYGAATWGQFFIYQGFNEHCGWMHTSSDADVADLYKEKIIEQDGKFSYEYDGKILPVGEKVIIISILRNGVHENKTFKTFYTGHGPIVTKKDESWLSLKSFNRSMTSLVQSWKRTKATGFDDFKTIMALRSNTSNNTVFADDKGNIAYWHGNFMPVRDTFLDWARPVDGTVSATEWKGLYEVDSTVHVYNPESGWIQNCNSTPFTCSGSSSPVKSNYPVYMAPDGENFRGINAARILDNTAILTLDELIATGYSTYLAAFEKLLPKLILFFNNNTNGQEDLRKQLAEPLSLLQHWDFRSAENSVATTLAVEWGQKLLSKIVKSADEDEYQYVDQVQRTENFLQRCNPADLLIPMQETINELTAKFGTWKIPWGQINRFQRLTNNINQSFADNEPSFPVPFTSSAWGALPSYSTQYFPGTKKRYGVGGNSFICAVDFGPKITAKSLLAGGESGDPSSKHFFDQGEMYAKGQFKDVLFYKDDVLKHAEKKYHPGE